MKTYQVVEALIPIANDIYDESSLDLQEVGNPSNRVICAPGEFTLGELIQEDEFRYENRGYENEDGSSSVNGVFAVKTISIPTAENFVKQLTNSRGGRDIYSKKECAYVAVEFARLHVKHARDKFIEALSLDDEAKRYVLEAYTNYEKTIK